MTFVATRADPGTVGLRMGSGWIGCVRDGLGVARCCWAVELEEEAGSSGLLAPGGVPQAGVADFVEAFGQNMLQEPAHELVAGDAAGPPSIGFAVLVADGHGLVVEADDTGVGNGDAEHVAGEVVEHGLLAFPPDRAVDDPGLGPRSCGQGQIRAARRKCGPELAAHKLGERLDGDKEGVSRGMPQAAVIRNAPAGDQAVDMGMEEELLGPGVQNGEYADRAADMARIAGKLDDRLGRGLHQHGVTVTLVGAQHLTQFFGDGDGDVEIAARQHLGAAGLQPAFGLVGMTFGTASVLAGVIGKHLGAAAVAAPEVSTEGFGAAGQDVGDGALMGRQYRRAMGCEVVVREAAEDVRDLDHSAAAASEAGHQSVEDTSERDAGWLGQVGVDGGGGDVGVAEQDLNDPGIDAIFEQPRRIAMAQ
jgi:hypothetical protein